MKALTFGNLHQKDVSAPVERMNTSVRELPASSRLAAGMENKGGLQQVGDENLQSKVQLNNLILSPDALRKKGSKSISEIDCEPPLTVMDLASESAVPPPIFLKESSDSENFSPMCIENLHQRLGEMNLSISTHCLPHYTTHESNLRQCHGRKGILKRSKKSTPLVERRAALNTPLRYDKSSCVLKRVTRAEMRKRELEDIMAEAKRQVHASLASDASLPCNRPDFRDESQQRRFDPLLSTMCPKQSFIPFTPYSGPNTKIVPKITSRMVTDLNIISHSLLFQSLEPRIITQHLGRVTKLMVELESQTPELSATEKVSLRSVVCMVSKIVSLCRCQIKRLESGASNACSSRGFWRNKILETNDDRMVLKTWFLENTDYPYPTVQQKKELSEKSGMSIKEITRWFVGARSRLQRGIICCNLIKLITCRRSGS